MWGEIIVGSPVNPYLLRNPNKYAGKPLNTITINNYDWEDLVPFGICHYCGHWFLPWYKETANCDWCKFFVNNIEKFQDKDITDEDHCGRCGKPFDIIMDEQKNPVDGGKFMCNDCIEFEIEKASIIKRAMEFSRKADQIDE